jgi:Fic family protein
MSDDTQRHTISDVVHVDTDPDAIAAREASNAIDQFDAVLKLIDEAVDGSRPFRLKPSTILSLHRIALNGLNPMAGTFRNASVGIHGSKHTPPREHLVPHLIEEMCDWLERNWADSSALRLCAYVMWRLNWIHPFSDGNGRTSRAVAYLVLCARAGFNLPGRKTIPEQIAENRTPYYEALEKLDEMTDYENPNLEPMVGLLEACLAEQLKSAFEAATDVAQSQSQIRKFH